MLVSVTDQVVHIAIDVSFDDEQIQGQVSDGTRPPKPFSGWLGLIGALDGMLGPPRPDGAVESARPRDPVRSAELGGER
jgi:hypothetical protein